MQQLTSPDKSDRFNYLNWVIPLAILLTYLGILNYFVINDREFQQLRTQQQIAQNLHPKNCEPAFTKTLESARNQTFSTYLQTSIDCIHANNNIELLKASVLLENLLAHQRYVAALSPHTLVEPEIKRLVTDKFETYQTGFDFVEEPAWLFYLHLFPRIALSKYSYLLFSPVLIPLLSIIISDVLKIIRGDL